MSKVEELRAKLEELRSAVSKADGSVDLYASREEAFRLSSLVLAEEHGERCNADIASVLEHRKALEALWTRSIETSERQASAWERIAAALEAREQRCRSDD